MSAKVVVVGGGIAGLSIAWELARIGTAVTLVRSDRSPTSLVAAGMLAPMPESQLTRRLTRPAAEALRHYPRFLEALAEDSARDVGFARCGVLRVAAGGDEVAALREEVGTYEAAGLPSQWLSAAASRELAPGLPETVAGALFSFEEAQVQPRWLLDALEEAAFRREVEFRDGEVTSIEAEGRGAAAVLTTGERMAADRVVLAAGSWSGALGGGAVPVRPVKGQLLAFHDVQGPTPIVYSGHNYLVSKADGSVLLGGTMEEAGFSLGGDHAGEALRDLLPGIWPGLQGAPAELRVGLRPATPDGLPLVGPLPRRPGVYAFTAHFRNGFLLCPHQARMAATEVIGGERVELLEAMRPGRFEGAALS